MLRAGEGGFSLPSLGASSGTVAKKGPPSGKRFVF